MKLSAIFTTKHKLTSAALAVGILVIAACSQQKQLETHQFVLDLIDTGKGFFSNRPTKPNQDPKTNYFFGLVKLKSPALFAGSKSKDGKVIIDDELAAAIEQEQTQFINGLSLISPEIKVIYKYKYILNAVSIYVPGAAVDKIRQLPEVVRIEEGTRFARPKVEGVLSADAGRFNERNSVKFIGAELAHKLKVKNPKGEEVPLNGTGLKVGVLDTGIDYTHKMFGGEGTEAAFKSVDVNKATPLFPNAKVIGGYDFVGTDFDSGNPEFRLPKPDANPIDEADHGTHVAGTIAGIGDGVEGYSGVAPGAALYALKVFGKKGSTDSPVVIAALEYAVDPNGDGKLDDQLDVVNLSLGSPYGTPHALYSEAIKNLTRGGTIVVASAGNEGDHKYITGEPAATEHAISVAATVDDMYHNWQFKTIRIKLVDAPDQVVEAIESSLSKPIADAGEVKGKFVFLGIADQDFSDDLKSKLKGNVALIDRGKVTFAEKIRRAHAAGAIGVVVANHSPGEPMVMGGEGDPVNIPAVMITQELGNLVKAQMAKGDVVMSFKNADTVNRPELIDTITGFSSRGPRSIDGLIKPEIGAPGASIVSAKSGSGNKYLKMSGTSMAGPHIAGVMALLKQARPQLNVSELKSLLLARAKTMTDAKKAVYPVARVGSGRVQVLESINAVAISDKSTLSLGIIPVQTVKMVRTTVNVKNISTRDLSLNLQFETRSKFISVKGPGTITVKAGSSTPVVLNFTLSSKDMKEAVRELDGWIKFVEKSDTGAVSEALRIPVLALSQKITDVKPTELVVHSSGPADAPNSAVDLKLKNTGANDADVLVFNLIGVDGRKTDAKKDPFTSRQCDLQAAGYRIIEKTENGITSKVLQVAAKIFEPLTSWHTCDFSVLIDSNGDGILDQEIAVLRRGSLPGISAPGKDEEMIGILVDSAKARQIAENALAKGAKKKESDFGPSVITVAPVQIFERSTILVVEAPVDALERRPTGELAIRVATTHGESSPIAMDDFLNKNMKEWTKISTLENSQSYTSIPESVLVKAGEEVTVPLTKGFGREPMLILMPNNAWVESDNMTDDQAVIAEPAYSFGSKPVIVKP